MKTLEEEISILYSDPAIGASNVNIYGEENIKKLVSKYKTLKEPESSLMLSLVRTYSQSGDLNSCYISVAVLHILEQDIDVSAAYNWAKTQNDASMYIQHFDIGIALADYLKSD